MFRPLPLMLATIILVPDHCLCWSRPLPLLVLAITLIGPDHPLFCPDHYPSWPRPLSLFVPTNTLLVPDHYPYWSRSLPLLVPIIALNGSDHNSCYRSLPLFVPTITLIGLTITLIGPDHCIYCSRPLHLFVRTITFIGPDHYAYWSRQLPSLVSIINRNNYCTVTLIFITITPISRPLHHLSQLLVWAYCPFFYPHLYRPLPLLIKTFTSFDPTKHHYSRPLFLFTVGAITSIGPGYNPISSDKYLNTPELHLNWTCNCLSTTLVPPTFSQLVPTIYTTLTPLVLTIALFVLIIDALVLTITVICLDLYHIRRNFTSLVQIITPLSPTIISYVSIITFVIPNFMMSFSYCSHNYLAVSRPPLSLVQPNTLWVPTLTLLTTLLVCQLVRTTTPSASTIAHIGLDCSTLIVAITALVTPIIMIIGTRHEYSPHWYRPFHHTSLLPHWWSLPNLSWPWKFLSLLTLTLISLDHYLYITLSWPLKHCPDYYMYIICTNHIPISPDLIPLVPYITSLVHSARTLPNLFVPLSSMFQPLFQLLHWFQRLYNCS